ncbi:hypothetical protein [Phosphitispora fastidiosa]|uniref:hypothetical protein n=1 Tax=Phosphitispora fastidiosa TaxID=2837202 RepID=UPI001E6321E8|nr:hypothetical protein [Phosphitispora fastidiosa]MBU7006126.1 hypothetical protein [Phosphitispora fastidiosa]
MISHDFSIRHNWWFDAGLAGLQSIAVEVRDKVKDYKDIKIRVTNEHLTFQAPSKEVLRNLLNDCYSLLADRYWNISDKKQRESLELVIYYQDTDDLGLIPKRKPTPIPSLFTKGSSWRAEAEEYAKLSTGMKQRVDEFLKNNNKKLWGNKKMLLFKPPVCHPQLELFPNKKNKTICCVCGREMVCSDVNQTSFLLFASKTAALSFNSQAKRPDKICWECEYLSKFAVESAFYKQNGDNIFILQLVTGNAQKMVESQAVLSSNKAVRKLDEDNFRANIGAYKQDNKLLFYAQLPYEILWTFFYDTYTLLREEADLHEDYTEDEKDEFCTRPFIESPIQLVLLRVATKGQTFITKEIIYYTETAYIFRLVNEIQKLTSSGDNLLYKLFHDLYLPREGKAFDINNYLWRNLILQKVLQKKSVLQDFERLTFRKCQAQLFPYLGNMLEFVQHYEAMIREGIGMTKEHIELAVKLGQQIVIGAKGKDSGKEGKDSNFDRVKGDMFVLRKTRTVTDFLEQLNRIQFRYNFTVSNQILNGVLHEPAVEFEDFKAYCLMAALNTYNNFKRPQIKE